MLFEFLRPPTPPGLPLVIATILFVGWLVRKDKQWSRQSPLWFAFLGAIAVGVVASSNTFSAYFSTRTMGLLFLGVCLPLQSLITSVHRLRVWIYTLIAISVCVGAWAATHSGWGPGNQDENYVSAMMAMASALSYFSLFAEKRRLPRLLLMVSITVFLAAVAAASDPSRGGFLALCAVAIYGLTRSPNKRVGVSVLVAGAFALLVIAGPRFWEEIDTTTDVHEGTADARLEIWANGLRMWRDNPVFGVGAGNFLWQVGNYQTPEQFAKFGRSLGGGIVAHSMVVECLSELGSAGAISLVVLVVLTWRGLGTVRRKIPGPRSAPADMDPELTQLRCYTDALRGAILAIVVSGVFLSLLYYSYLWVLLAVGGATPFVFRRFQGTEGARGGERTPAGGPAEVRLRRRLVRQTDADLGLEFCAVAACEAPGRMSP